MISSRTYESQSISRELEKLIIEWRRATKGTCYRWLLIERSIDPQEACAARVVREPWMPNRLVPFLRSMDGLSSSCDRVKIIKNAPNLTLPFVIKRWHETISNLSWCNGWQLRHERCNVVIPLLSRSSGYGVRTTEGLDNKLDACLRRSIIAMPHFIAQRHWWGATLRRVRL